MLIRAPYSNRSNNYWCEHRTVEFHVGLSTSSPPRVGRWHSFYRKANRRDAEWSCSTRRGDTGPIPPVKTEMTIVVPTRRGPSGAGPFRQLGLAVDIAPLPLASPLHHLAATSATWPSPSALGTICQPRWAVPLTVYLRSPTRSHVRIPRNPGGRPAHVDNIPRWNRSTHRSDTS